MLVLVEILNKLRAVKKEKTESVILQSKKYREQHMRDFISKMPLITTIISKPVFIEFNRHVTITIKIEDLCLKLFRETDVSYMFMKKVANRISHLFRDTQKLNMGVNALINQSNNTAYLDVKKIDNS